MKKLIFLTATFLISCNTTVKNENKELPGRIGNKELTVNEDKRINPELLQAMINLGLDGVPPPPPVTFESSQDEIQEFNNSVESIYTEVFGTIFSKIELPHGLVNETKIITGDRR